MWSLPLPEPFQLKSGKTVATLGDARALILKLPKARQAEQHWLHAATLLLDAAEARTARSMALANIWLYKAVKAEGIA